MASDEVQGPVDPSLVEELRQSRPFTTLDAETLVAVMRTSDAVRAHLQAAMTPFGVTLQQYNVLRILRGAGPQGLPTLSVAERMIERTPGVTRLLDRLEAQGLVLRTRGTDRRQVLASITELGLDLLDRMSGPLARADAAAVSALSDREKEELVGLLARMRAGTREAARRVAETNPRDET